MAIDQWPRQARCQPKVYKVLVYISNKYKQVLLVVTSRTNLYLYIRGNFIDYGHFWDFDFIFCLYYILNLIKNLRLKIKRLKIDIIKDYIRKIWTNQIIVQLKKLINKNMTSRD